MVGGDLKTFILSRNVFFFSPFGFSGPRSVWVHLIIPNGRVAAFLHLPKL